MHKGLEVATRLKLISRNPFMVDYFFHMYIKSAMRFLYLALYFYIVIAILSFQSYIFYFPN